MRRATYSVTYDVESNTVSISTSALKTDTWYDHRGNVIETAPPGGLVTKTVFDGARRPVITYSTDGAGGTSWADAGNVTEDTVLTETETQYDADGNPILVTTGTGSTTPRVTEALGDPSTRARGAGFLRSLLLRRSQPPNGHG